MSEELKEAKVVGYTWKDPELVLAEEFPNNADDTKCIIKRHEKKESYFYCPKCNKLDPIPIVIDIDITHNHPLARVYTEGLKITCKCKECESDMIAIDRYIAEPVDLLCNAGYKVVDCSQGNVTAIPGEREDIPEEEDYYFHINDAPYIMFDKKYPELEKMELPQLWYFEDTEYSYINDKDERCIKQTTVLKCAIAGNFIDEKAMEDSGIDPYGDHDVKDILLNMDGYIHYGYGISCKELTDSIKEFLSKN